MWRLLKITIFVLCFTSLAAFGQTNPVHHVDTSLYVILKIENLSDLSGSRSAYRQAPTLSSSQVDNMEPLVDSAYRQLIKRLSRKHQGVKPLSAYKRQYTAVTNDKGQKEVWIYFICDPPADWRKRPIIVDDGGSCYLNITVNLTLGTASELVSNGEG